MVLARVRPCDLEDLRRGIARGELPADAEEQAWEGVDLQYFGFKFPPDDEGKNRIYHRRLIAMGPGGTIAWAPPGTQLEQKIRSLGELGGTA
jgi:hypothetical protein